MKYLTPTLLALSGAIFASATASAVTYNDGDLLLGFRSVTSNFDFVINLGPDANFMTNGANSGLGTGLYSTGGLVTVLAAGSLSGDLTAGRSLNSGTFGLFGADNSNTDFLALFGTKRETTPGTQSSAQANPSLSAALTVNSNLAAEGSQFKKGADTQHGTDANQSLGSAANSVLQHIAADTNPNVAPNSYNSFVSTAPAFAFFNAPYEGSYASGSNSDVLDLYEFDADQSGNGKLLGGLRVASNGAVQFSSNLQAFAVPEPSTIAALATGLGLLALRRRRRGVPSVV